MYTTTVALMIVVEFDWGGGGEASRGQASFIFTYMIYLQ